MRRVSIGGGKVRDGEGRRGVDNLGGRSGINQFGEEKVGRFFACSPFKLTKKAVTSLNAVNHSDCLFVCVCGPQFGDFILSFFKMVDKLVQA